MALSHQGTQRQPADAARGPDRDPLSPPATRTSSHRLRDPRLWIGVLLVAGAVLAGARFMAAADHTVAVWRLARDVPAGSAIDRDALRATRVHFTDDAAASAYLSASESPQADARATRDLRTGELLSASALTTAADRASRQLPLALTSGGLPPDLAEGDRVEVWAMPPPDQVAGRSRRVLPDVAVVSLSDPGPAGAAAERQVLVALDDSVNLARALDALNGATVVLVRIGD